MNWAMYIIGVLIVSMSMGHMFTQLHGWLTLGIMLMLTGIIRGMAMTAPPRPER